MPSSELSIMFHVSLSKNELMKNPTIAVKELDKTETKEAHKLLKPLTEAAIGPS